jgi:hypothetical protein
MPQKRGLQTESERMRTTERRIRIYAVAAITWDLSRQEWFQLPGVVKALVLFCRRYFAACCAPILEHRSNPTPDEVLFSLEGQRGRACGGALKGYLKGLDDDSLLI